MSQQERANLGLHDHVIGKIQRMEPALDTSILDLGCGTGSLLRRLRGLGYGQLAGVDIAAPEDVDGIRFHSIDLDKPKLPIADSSVSLVVAVEIVEHLENLGAVLAELRRVLTPTGRVLITTPNVHSIEARLRLLLTGKLKQFDQIGDPTHIVPIFLFPFRRLVARHGFTIADQWGFPGNGRSPTSRPALRMLAALARLAGASGNPDGDQLCLLLENHGASPASAQETKAAALTAHY